MDRKTIHKWVWFSLAGISKSAGKVDRLAYFPEMDLPAAISLPTNKVDVVLSVEDASIALSSIATKYPSSRPSVLEHSESLGASAPLRYPATISGGSLFQVIAYSIDCSAPPFPVFVCAYFINGIGLALQNAQSVGIEFVIWFAPSLVGAVAVAIIGVLLGPMYPIAMNHCGRVFPRKLLPAQSAGLLDPVRQGLALVPFMAGAVTSKAGIETLQPVLVGILGFMTVLWALIPKSAQRND
ncbi:hypothetical protein OG21DRAFT_1495672 [Imleria badia]|nr:hypothetical protein OG21DRAFT_1495672 [Imleria badia]